MKVYYVNSELNGCYNVRCLFPLQENGWDGDRTSFALTRPKAERKAKALLDAEVIVFHRPEKKNKIEAARLLKEQGKKIVFDNDDTYKDTGGFKFTEYMNEAMLKRGLKTLNENIDTFIKEADLVTCATEFLKKEYELINPNVIVLPNCIDPFYFPEPKRNEEDVIRIGVTGSVAMTSDLEVLQPIVDHYEHDKRVRLVLLSIPAKSQNQTYQELYAEEYDWLSKKNIEWHTLVPCDEYYEALNDLKLDMVIIPRYNSPFSRCKSNLKFLENSMLEIPSVCQAFSTGDSPYQQNPNDAKHLLLADTQEEWIEQIEKLIKDKELRRKMGKEAREYVEEIYSIENNAHKWVDAYQTLYNNDK